VPASDRAEIEEEKKIDVPAPVHATSTAQSPAPFRSGTEFQRLRSSCICATTVCCRADPAKLPRPPECSLHGARGRRTSALRQQAAAARSDRASRTKLARGSVIGGGYIRSVGRRRWFCEQFFVISISWCWIGLDWICNVSTQPAATRVPGTGQPYVLQEFFPLRRWEVI
jgi:hypothetical protein